MLADLYRIDRYSRASQSNAQLTKSNLQPGSSTVPQTPKSNMATHPGSPVTSMHALPSAVNLTEQMQFSALPPGATAGPQQSPIFPAQQARFRPGSAIDLQSAAVTQPASPTRVKDESFERPRRTSSMILDHGTGAPPQPQGAGIVAQNSFQQPLPSSSTQSAVMSPDEPLSLTRTTSSAGLTLDGIEPKIFPGVVSRRRRSSLRGGSLEDGEGSVPHGQGQPTSSGHSGFVRGDNKSTVVENDSDDDEST